MTLAANPVRILDNSFFRGVVAMACLSLSVGCASEASDPPGEPVDDDTMQASESTDGSEETTAGDTDTEASVETVDEAVAVVGTWSSCEGTVTFDKDGRFEFEQHELTAAEACTKTGTYVVEDGRVDFEIESDECGQDSGAGAFNIVVRDDYLVMVGGGGREVVFAANHVERSAWRVLTAPESGGSYVHIITTYGDGEDPILGCFAPEVGHECEGDACEGSADFVRLQDGRFKAILTVAHDECIIATNLRGELDEFGRVQGDLVAHHCGEKQLGKFIAERIDL